MPFAMSFYDVGKMDQRKKNYHYNTNTQFTPIQEV